VSPRALAIALFASVALNLFGIGAVVGGFVIAHRLHEMAPQRAPVGQGPLWAAADALPPEHRDAYHDLLRGQALTVGQQVRQARQARRQAWAGLMAEPFDAKGTAKNLADARALEIQARGEVEQKIVEFAATLPAAERAELAQGLGRSAPMARGGIMRRLQERRNGAPQRPPAP
jgi:uncharacterized membrane protein